MCRVSITAVYTNSEVNSQKRLRSSPRAALGDLETSNQVEQEQIQEENKTYQNHSCGHYLSAHACDFSPNFQSGMGFSNKKVLPY